MIRSFLLLHLTMYLSLCCTLEADYTYVFGSGEFLPVPSEQTGGPNIQGVLKIATGKEHTLILKLNGSVWSAGSNEFGQLGTATVGPELYFRPIVLGAVDIATTDTASFWVRPDATLWSVGSDLFSVDADFRTIPTIVDLNVRAIFAGKSHLLILKTDASLWAIGGGFGTQDGTDHLKPQKIADNVVTAAAGTYHSFYIRSDDTLWGIGFDGDLMRINTSEVQTGAARLLASNAKAVAAGDTHSLLLKTDNSMWGEGTNASGELGLGDQNPRTEYVAISPSAWQIVAKGASSAFIDASGRLKTMGKDRFNEPPESDRLVPVNVSENTIYVSLGEDFAAYTTSLELTYNAVGGNSSGQLGLQAPPSVDYPLMLAENIRSVSTQYAHILLLDDEGQLWAAGENFKGAIGSGTLQQAITPFKVDTDVAEMSAGEFHSLYLKNDQSLWGMGSNSVGALGDGTVVDQLSPIEISQDVIALAAGDDRSFFVKSDHSLWAMGKNWEGNLGDGTRENRLTPVKILDGADSVVSYGHHTLIHKTDGTLWGIGRVTQPFNIPISDPFIKVADDVVLFDVGEKHILFLNSSGELWGEGANDYGQIGLGWGDSTQQVMIAMDVVDLDAAGDHSLFLTSDSNLWAYGRNIGNALTKSVPRINRNLVHVAGNVERFATGARYTLIISGAPPGSDQDMDGRLAIFDPNDLNPYNPFSDSNGDYVADNYSGTYPEGNYRPVASDLQASLNGPTARFPLSPGFLYYFEVSDDLKTWSRADAFAYPSIRVDHPTLSEQLRFPLGRFVRLVSELD